ncbi:MAG: methyltransferase [Deltaproteobacteria bacterium]|nr:methyltransferase [Deltaproteobacteria bacterium]
MDGLTTDTFFEGRITVQQARAGYRYSIDAVILANQVCPRPADRILDLGTGCGIIPLIVAFRYPGAKLYGVEIQRDLVEIARANVSANGLENSIEILHMDMKMLVPSTISDPVDLVVSNPPFHRISSGRINSDSQRAVARHELRVALADVLAAAGHVLRTAGKFICIYRSDRLVDLFLQMRASRIEPKYTRLIHSSDSSDARLVLVEGMKRGNAGLTVGAPLTIYRRDRTYTDEMERMFDPEC